MTTNGPLQKTQRLELENRGEITLQPANHIATGGEGSVYKISSKTLVKVYSDLKKINSADLEAKIHRLSRIKHPFIVAPQGLVFQNKKPVGFYMNYEKADPLARVFTSAYRQRENFKDKDAIVLVDGMRTTVLAAHKEKAVMIDANEFNWLVSRSNAKVEPRIIDVDSWSIDGWKSNVIMASIRDWHTKGYNEGSDWFSYAVVSFQVFSGIHPYKGVLAGYKPNDPDGLEKRMRDNKSVFSPGIGLNSAVRDFSCIPVPLLEWYEAVFENTERSIPPSPLQSSNKAPRAARIQRIIVSGANDLLTLEMIYDAVNDTPVKIFPSGVVRLASGKLISLSKKSEIAPSSEADCEVIEVEPGLLIAEVNQNGMLECRLAGNDGKLVNLASSIQARAVLRYQNRLFAVNDNGLLEISLAPFSKPLVVTGAAWQVMVNSTKWYDGLGVQDSLGAIFLVMPFGKKSLSYVRVPELDKKRIVDAKAGNQYAVIVAVNRKTGLYEKYELVFDPEYKTYQLASTAVSTAELNLALLPKGVLAAIPEDGKLIITVPTNGQEKIVDDRRVEAVWDLANWGDRVVCIQGKKVWSMRLK